MKLNSFETPAGDLFFSKNKALSSETKIDPLNAYFYAFLRTFCICSYKFSLQRDFENFEHSHFPQQLSMAQASTIPIFTNQSQQLLRIKPGIF